MDLKRHWETIYQTKGPGEMSWTQPDPTRSTQIILQFAPPPLGRVLDAGGGNSLLVDRLLESGYERPEVLDLSGRALALVRDRLGTRADKVVWHEADVLTFRPRGSYDLWHDRAVYHFLIESSDRLAYRETLERSLRPGGHLVLATFAPDGPDRCSNLPVQRWDGDRLMREWGPGWRLVSEDGETHHTPWGKPQAFRYFLIRRD